MVGGPCTGRRDNEREALPTVDTSYQDLPLVYPFAYVHKYLSYLPTLGIPKHDWSEIQ